MLGAEGKGLRQKTRETVTALARLDMPGAIRSLNVSNAAAMALYAARKLLAQWQYGSSAVCDAQARPRRHPLLYCLHGPTVPYYATSCPAMRSSARTSAE